MEFLKKNYEKLLLGIVLLGLLVAVGFMLVVVSNEKAKLADLTSSVLHPHVKPLTNLDLSMADAALKQVATPAVIDFGPPNRLFNPMPWQKADRLIPATKVGPNAITVSNIRPLYLKLTLDKVEPSDSGYKYLIGIEKQAAPTPGQRNKREAYCKINDKDSDKTFQLVDVRGKPEDPSAVVLLLLDSGEKVTIEKGADGKYEPYMRVDGYMADLHYDLEHKNWPDRRVNSQPPIFCNGEEYNIVAINQNEVVLSARSNGKKWTLKTTTTSDTTPKPS